MQTMTDLINARADQYSFLNNDFCECPPNVANILFNALGFEENFFDVYENLDAVLIFNARVADDRDTTAFFILKYADHYAANVGAMINEESGELIDLFDETCQIFDVRPQ